MLDYLIVGLGIAGTSLCEQLENSNKTFKVVSDISQTSSRVAGGLYNPVILKRFTMAWKAKEQLQITIPFYKSLEKKLNKKLNYKLPVLRRFASVEEQNLWFEACDKPLLEDFLSQKLLKNTNNCIDAPLGYGEVLGTGRIDTSLLISSYQAYLFSNDLFYPETFDFEQLKVQSGYISYKKIKAKRIVFAEGYGLKKNPFFSYLPLTSTKGEYLTIKTSQLNETCAIKSSIFIIPWQKDQYRVGATYKWKDTTNLPTEESKKELIQKLDMFLNCDYEVIDQVAGIRPTVTDRRPLVGRHPRYDNLFVLNGFGSRGVMIAPFAAKQLVNLIESDEMLLPEMNIERFTKKHFKN